MNGYPPIASSVDLLWRIRDYAYRSDKVWFEFGGTIEPDTNILLYEIFHALVGHRKLYEYHRKPLKGFSDRFECNSVIPLIASSSAIPYHTFYPGELNVVCYLNAEDPHCTDLVVENITCNDEATLRQEPSDIPHRRFGSETTNPKGKSVTVGIGNTTKDPLCLLVVKRSSDPVTNWHKVFQPITEAIGQLTCTMESHSETYDTSNMSTMDRSYRAFSKHRKACAITVRDFFKNYPCFCFDHTGKQPAEQVELSCDRDLPSGDNWLYLLVSGKPGTEELYAIDVQTIDR